jgi:hypothetical protein
LYHQSQKRQGNVSRERFERIWVRAEDRNRKLPNSMMHRPSEYKAIEAFKRLIIRYY